MHADHVVPLGLFHLEQHRRADDARVVDQSGQAQPLGAHRGNGAGGEGRVADVTGEDLRGRNIGLQRFERLSVEVHRDDGAAQIGDQPRQCAPDPLTGAGDDDHLAFERSEILHVRFLFLLAHVLRNTGPVSPSGFASKSTVTASPMAMFSGASMMRVIIVGPSSSVT